jgi:hypothetical protein
MFTGRIPFEVVHEQFGRGTSSRPWLWSGVGLAAAAALVMVLVLGSSSPTWQVLQATAKGPIIVNGQEMAAEALAGAEFQAGTRIRGGDEGQVDLVVSNALSFILGPGAEVTIGEDRRLLGSATLTAVVHQGTTWGTTGPDFPEGGFRIETDQALVHVTGTTFAVLQSDEVTCICVLAGTVEVEAKGTGERLFVPPQQQFFVPSGQEPSQLVPITPGQRSRLKSIRTIGVSTSR